MDIIIDTREQQPWLFVTKSANIISRKLDTGDYSIDGWEDKFCIERKKSVSELAKNIVEDRFERELERMSEFLYPFILLEFDYNDIAMYPEGSNLPKRVKSKIRIKEPFIKKRLCEIQIKYNIHIIFCTNVVYAENIAYGLMKQINDTRL